MLTSRLTVNRAALQFLSDNEFIEKKDVLSCALKVARNYRKRFKDKTDTKTELLEDPALLISRVQNEVLLQVTETIKDNYSGESYRWLPSDAEEPDPEHQLKYGEIFQVGVGEMPGDRYGCRCGMEILVDQKNLEL